MRLFLLLVLMMFHEASMSHAAPLHEAAKTGDVVAIAAALDAGADVNGGNGIATALYYAIDKKHLEAAKLLIARGADPDLAEKWGPPLLVAAESGKPEFVRLLLDAGADASIVFKSHTALHYAAGSGCLDCVVTLIERGADVNALNSLRQPPIHFAVSKGHEAVADYLLAHGHSKPTPTPIANLMATADPLEGAALFKKTCRKCHLSEPNSGSFMGPSLWNIVGRQRGAVEGYRYSTALRGIGGVWSYQNLNIFISDPSRAIPGVDMVFEGIQDDMRRADLIAFLRGRTLLPLHLPE